MPKVKGQQSYFGGKLTFFEVYCSAAGVFTAKLPPWAREVLGKEQLSAKTLNELEGLWEAAKREYEETQTTTRTVILYKCEMTARLDNGKEFNNAAFKLLLDRADISFTDGVALDFGVAVFVEKKRLRHGGSPAYSYSHIESTIPESFKPSGFSHALRDHKNRPLDNLLPWTEEREVWFAGLCRAYQNLLLGLDAIFKDKKTLQLAIEQRKQLGAGVEE